MKQGEDKMKQNELKERARRVFEKYGFLDEWNKTTNEDFKMVGKDLYFYDPKHESGLFLGDLNPWYCIDEYWEPKK